MDLNLCTVFPRIPDFKFVFGFHKIIVPVSRNIWANTGKWSWKVRCGSECGMTEPFSNESGLWANTVQRFRSTLKRNICIVLLTWHERKVQGADGGCAARSLSCGRRTRLRRRTPSHSSCLTCRPDTERARCWRVMFVRLFSS